MNDAALAVYCTVPDSETGKSIAEIIVKERLCACVTRIPGVVSHYIYENEYCVDNEHLLIIKTTAEVFPALRARLEALHPYDVPEIIAMRIETGNDAYLAWLRRGVRS